MRFLSPAAGRRRLSLSIVMLANLVAVVIAAAVPTSGQARTSASGAHFTSRVLIDGSKMFHSTPGGSKAIADPDDVTTLDGRIFVGFQNGVGPQGQAGTGGTRDSTIVELTRTGHEVGQWDIVGKCDGLTADPGLGRVIATVNEDAHSSLYLLNPSGTGSVTHYHYASALSSKGGTDAIDIDKGMILISASAPGTTGTAAPQASYPAVYIATLTAATKSVVLKPLFFDESSASAVNHGETAAAQLALTDPDSNATVPSYASRFAGDFELTSQGDKEQIFVTGAGTAAQKLEMLKLDGSVDDSAWPSGAEGTLYVTDNASNRVYAITGPFTRGSEVVAETPCDANGAPATCPARNFPDNYLATVNSETGVSTPIALSGPKPAAQGLLWMP